MMFAYLTFGFFESMVYSSTLLGTIHKMDFLFLAKMINKFVCMVHDF